MQKILNGWNDKNLYSADCDMETDYACLAVIRYMRKAIKYYNVGILQSLVYTSTSVNQDMTEY